METFLSISAGLALSAACGFRVFVPLLIMSIASMSGHLHLSNHFQWIGTYPALITLATATALEIGGYYIPWVDNFLDSIATPAAVVAGTMVAASLAPEMSPFLKWTLAAIGGGGLAGLVQGSTVLARGASSLTTGGLGNPVLATVEAGSAVTFSLLAIIAPILAIILIIALLVFIGRKIYQRSLVPKPA